jgi:type IV pilus assembly protein PilW
MRTFLGSNRRRQRGLSLVELMVGMAVGLIGITIITHLYITNEKYKRSTTGSGQAQVNGAIALYTLERDIRMAGFGLNHSGALGCSCDTATFPACSPLQYWKSGTYSAPTGARPALRFVPVLITETANQPDSVTVLYGNGPDRMLPSSLSESMTGAGTPFKVDGSVGYCPKRPCPVEPTSDMIVVANGATCRLAQITNVVDAASNLEHSGGWWNPPSGGSLPTFGAASSVFNLGSPTWRIYSIGSDKLQFSEVLTTYVDGGAATAIIDDIVDLQAQYGKDTNNDDVVDAWNTTLPTTSAEWQQVLAIRVAILSRSQNYERPANAGDPCEATTLANRPKWGAATPPTEDFTRLKAELDVAPSCYKHRVFETIIPLRNMIWRPA